MLSDDQLPQPYRMINKIVQRCVGDALETIGQRLQQGHVVGKKFAPGRGVPAVTETSVALNTAVVAPCPQPATPVVTLNDHTETIVALTDGTVAIFDLDSQQLTRQSPRVFTPEVANGSSSAEPAATAAKGQKNATSPTPSGGAVDGGAIVAIANGTPFAPYPIYAAATSTRVCIFAFESLVKKAVDFSDVASGAGSVAPRSTASRGATPAPEDDGPKYRVVSQFSVPVDGGRIQSISISPEGAFLAVTVAKDAPTDTTAAAASPTNATAAGAVPPPAAPPTFEVLAYQLPSHTLSAAARRQSSVMSDATAAPTPIETPKPRLIRKLSLPVEIAMPGQTPCLSVKALFQAHGAPPVLGYGKFNGIHTVSLFIAWIGTNIVSRVPVREGNPTIAADMEKARLAAEENVTVSSPVKEDKKADQKKGKGKQEAVQELPTITALPPPEAAYCGVSHGMTPQLITTAVASATGERVAVGCLDGISHVYGVEPFAPSHTFSEAPHRQAQRSVALMVCGSLQFQGNGRLIATHVIPDKSDRSLLAVYDLDSKTPASDTHVSAAGGSIEYRSCIGGKGKRTALVRYVNKLYAAVPVGGLPLVALIANEKAYIIDCLSGEAIAELKLSNGLAIDWGDNRWQHNDFQRAIRDINERSLVARSIDGGVAVLQLDEQASRAPSPNHPPALSLNNHRPSAAGDLSTSRAERSMSKKDLKAERSSSMRTTPATSPSVAANTIAFFVAPCEEAVFSRYPAVGQAFRSCSVEQLGFVLERVQPDQRDDHDALTAVTLPGLGGNGYQGAGYGDLKKKTVSDVASTTRGPQVHSGGSIRSRNSRTGGSIVGNTVGTRTLGSISVPVAITPVEIPADASETHRVRALIDAREASRATRSVKMRQQWEAAKQSLRR